MTGDDTPDESVPGGRMAGEPDVFDQIVLVGDTRLGASAVEDIFRASLIAGAACARSLVKRVSPLRDAWDAENEIGAALLTEFWSALIASRLLGKVEDRDDVLVGISERFAGDIFGSSRSALEWSLQTFEQQLASGVRISADGDSPTVSPMTWFYLYWRSRDLLVGDLPLQGRYHAAPDLETWQADRRHTDIAPPTDLEGPTLAREILLWGVDAASEHYHALRQTADEERGGLTPPQPPI